MKKGLTTVSEALSLAFHAMAILAQNPQARLRTGEIALSLDVSAHHLSKILQRLKKVGLVDSSTGPKGGHRLARPPEEITLLDIYQAIEGSLPMKPCLFGRSACRARTCPFSDLLREINEKAQRYFSQKRLSDVSLKIKKCKGEL